MAEGVALQAGTLRLVVGRVRMHCNVCTFLKHLQPYNRYRGAACAAVHTHDFVYQYISLGPDTMSEANLPHMIVGDRLGQCRCHAGSLSTWTRQSNLTSLQSQGHK